MSSTQLVVIAVVLIALVGGSLVAWSWRRHRPPGERVGSEYERALAQSDGRLAAERELRDGQRRQAALEFRTLSPQARAAYVAKWRQLEPHFADAPQDAVNEADDLVTRLITELGYPLGDQNKLTAHLSLEHVNTLESYREAHRISTSNRRGEATTEQLRLATVRFRVLVVNLLGEEPVELVHP